MQIESASREDRREVQFPVMEALTLRDLSGRVQPWVLLVRMTDAFRTGEDQVVLLGDAEFLPTGVWGEAELSAAFGEGFLGCYAE